MTRQTKRHSGSLSSFVLASCVAIAVAGCASTRPVSTQLDDAAITTKVKAKLTADPEINSFKIDVDTREGIVRLSGIVKKPEVRAEAEKLARNTVGVRGVINELEIGSESFGRRVNDAAIATKVKAKLTADPEVNPFNIDVDCQEGVVTLSGRVRSAAQRQEAEKLARNTAGVREVRNRLEVGAVGKGGGR